jgi:peptidoglycan/LPS O-acetylase OafA/YrhL
VKVSYRPEIDGLRAIAVVAVIIYHAQITIFDLQLFKGGFIGVDIFFVISGYLITSIVLKELITTGTFSFKHFYERRIRRILPALLLVMLVSLPFAWMYLLPNSFIDFCKSILSSLGFGSNFYFHFSGQRYAAENALLKPFLHTWSLSVEEQFYILFPIVLLITFKYFRKYLIYILILGFVVSLGLADWGSIHHPFFNFYVLSSRGWELLAGSILAYFEIINGDRSKNRTLNSILPFAGLILVGHSILFFNDRMFHPSFYTLSPIIGVCLIIWFSNKDEIITKILSTKLFVGIGLISYSLYLWHYPIFAFARVIDFIQGDIVKKLLLGFIIFLLSIFSYFLIERPARNKKYKFTYIFNILLVCILIITIFNFIVIFKNGLKDRFSGIILNTENNLNYRLNYQNNIRCHNRLGNRGFCIYNASEENIGDIILLGDSMVDSILGNFIEKVKKSKFRLIHMSYSANLYLPDFVRFNKKKNIITQSEDYHNFRKNFINNSSKNTYIVILGNYTIYFEKKLKLDENGNISTYETDNKFVEKNDIELNYNKRITKLKLKFKNTLLELSKDKKIILLYPLPHPPTNVLRNILSNHYKGFYKDKDYYLKDKINYSKDFYLKINKEIIELFDEINSKNIYKIKTENIFCPQDKCIFYDNQFAYFFDSTHNSYKGSEILNEIIFKEIEKIEAKSN